MTLINARRPSRKGQPAKKGRFSTKTDKKWTMTKRGPVRATFGRQLMPPQLFNSLRYAQIIRVTSDANGQAVWLISCNGLFNPSTTGAGHQPQGFDQISAFYDHYTVLSSSFKATIMDFPDTDILTHTVYIDDDTNINVANFSVAAEREGAKTVFAQLSAPVTITAGWNASRTFGGDPLANDNLQGTAAANPVEESHFANVIYGGPALSIGWVIEVQYNVVWDELKSLSSS